MKFLATIHKYDVSLFTRLLNARWYGLLVNMAWIVSRTGDGELYLAIIALFYGLHDADSPFFKGRPNRVCVGKADLFRLEEQS